MRRSRLAAVGRLGALLALAALVDGCAHRPSSIWHRIAAGETLSRIAVHYRVSIDEIVAANGIRDPNAITAGGLLLIPEGEPRRPGRTPSLSIGVAAAGVAGELPGAVLAWPVRGPISSPFGVREGRLHQGVDLRVPDGTPVRAADDGEVIYAGRGLRGYGHLVVLRHLGDLSTVYAHNSSILVAERQQVLRGQPIALSGHSGRATAPHLHFEVRRGPHAVDPQPLLTPVVDEGSPLTRFEAP